MSQTMVNIEAILRRLNKVRNKEKPLRRPTAGVGGHKGNPPGGPTVRKHYPPIKKDKEAQKKKQQGTDEQILKGKLGFLKGMPPARGPHDKIIRDIVDRDKDNDRSSIPTGKLPSKGVNKKAAIERRLKNKNYTQTGEDAGWHRDRRVKKSQGRPIEETPKQKKTRQQIAREALLRRRKSA